jgi:hypothetical membrane protein
MSQSEETRADIRQRRIKNSHLAGAFLISAGVVFTVFNTIAESIYPNYIVRTAPLSDLGAIGHSTTFLWNGQLFVTGILGLVGICLLVFRSSLLEYLQSTPVKILYFLPNIGTVIVSLFPENSILAIHALGAFMTFVFGAISAIYAFRFTKSPFRYFCVLLGAISLTAIPFFGAPSLLGFGGVERLVVYSNTIWAIAFGAYLTAL